MTPTRPLGVPALVVLLTSIAGLGAVEAGTKHKPAKPAGSHFTDREGQVEFATPSHNVGCVYTPAGGTSWYKPADGGPELSCDRVKPTYVNVRMSPAGEPQRADNPGEQPCCQATNILAYGKTWGAGPFSCSASGAGLACKRADGRGFTLSKKDVVVK